MTDQISFLPMLEPRDTSFEDNERKASQICDEEFERADGDIVKYVAACVDRFDKELPFAYDLRDDDRVKNEDVVGKCFLCGRDVTAQDVCLVDVVTYTWERKRRAHNRYYASEKGKENRKGADARFRENHREERNEYSRKYYREHKEYFAEYQRKYRARKAA